NKLDFKSIIVASSNDVWVSLDRSTYFARCWGSELINIGEAGHINSASGHCQWHEGLALLQQHFPAG
ncbi:MAG TPA: alpha/beta hydrolase, partial [Ferruginibacter sp.]|nr:alpha/beta hydrolase [Ferruginibacter sp.]